MIVSITYPYILRSRLVLKMINGMINIYKEAGFTSHDVVAKLRGILKQKKIGHTGTLDPQAVGVLPVCLGNATKLCDLLTDKDKEYEAVLRLGVVTDTQDMTGEILKEFDVTVTAEEAVKAVLSFVGDYNQIPPMYSALKVNGQKLYDLARQGKEVERQARPVTIHTIDIIDVELPRIRFRVACSKGTYIRTLCHDIGEKLGCGGAMESLKRTRVGSFVAEEALTLSEVEKLRDEGNVDGHVLKVEEVFGVYPKVAAKADGVRLLKNGNVLYRNQVVKVQDEKQQNIFVEDIATDESDSGFVKQGFTLTANVEGSLVRMYDDAGMFYGIYEYRKNQGIYKPYKMFLPNEA